MADRRPGLPLASAAVTPWERPLTFSPTTADGRRARRPEASD
jgi:hypothetical protein